MSDLRSDINEFMRKECKEFLDQNTCYESDILNAIAHLCGMISSEEPNVRKKALPIIWKHLNIQDCRRHWHCRTLFGDGLWEIANRIQKSKSGLAKEFERQFKDMSFEPNQFWVDSFQGELRNNIARFYGKRTDCILEFGKTMHNVFMWYGNTFLQIRMLSLSA